MMKLMVKSNDAAGMRDLVNALAKIHGGQAETSQVLAVETTCKALVEGLKLLFPGNVVEIHEQGEAKRLHSGIPSAMNITEEHRRRACAPKPELGARFCRNCLKSYEPRRANSLTCGLECSRQFGVRKIQYRRDKGMEINDHYFYRGDDGHLHYFSEVEFKNKLREGFFPEGAKILTPEGWLRVVHMQGGEWTFDEIHPS